MADPQRGTELAVDEQLWRTPERFEFFQAVRLLLQLQSPDDQSVCRCDRPMVWVKRAIKSCSRFNLGRHRRFRFPRPTWSDMPMPNAERTAERPGHDCWWLSSG